MTRYFISPVLFAVMTIACSSSTTTEATGEETGGSTSIETTAAGTGSSNSTGGSGNIGTTGGSGNSTVTTTSQSTLTTGGSGTSTTGSTVNTCVPKTCDQIAPAWAASSSCLAATLGQGCLTKPTACGAASDGCGGLLNCGTCITDGTANTDCGQEPATYQDVDLKSRGLVATANVCGTRCFKAPDIGGCTNGTPIIFCPSSIPPLGLSGCTSMNASVNSWCCNPTS